MHMSRYFPGLHVFSAGYAFTQDLPDFAPPEHHGTKTGIKDFFRFTQPVCAPVIINHGAVSDNHLSHQGFGSIVI